MKDAETGIKVVIKRRGAQEPCREVRLPPRQGQSTNTCATDLASGDYFSVSITVPRTFSGKDHGADLLLVGYTLDSGLALFGHPEDLKGYRLQTKARSFRIDAAQHYSGISDVKDFCLRRETGIVKISLQKGDVPSIKLKDLEKKHLSAIQQVQYDRRQESSLLQGREPLGPNHRFYWRPARGKAGRKVVFWFKYGTSDTDEIQNIRDSPGRHPAVLVPPAGPTSVPRSSAPPALIARQGDQSSRSQAANIAGNKPNNGTARPAIERPPPTASSTTTKRHCHNPRDEDQDDEETMPAKRIKTESATRETNADRPAEATMPTAPGEQQAITGSNEGVSSQVDREKRKADLMIRLREIELEREEIRLRRELEGLGN